MPIDARNLLVLSILLWAPATLSAQTINEKIVKYCKENLAKKIGDGECSSLAVFALKSAGAKSPVIRKDSQSKTAFIWGQSVLSLTYKNGKVEETKGKDARVKPGDIIQMRDVKIESGFSVWVFPQHTAIVAAWRDKGRVVTVFEQNVNGKREVMENIYRLDDLKAGSISVFRPLAR